MTRKRNDHYPVVLALHRPFVRGFGILVAAAWIAGSSVPLRAQTNQVESPPPLELSLWDQTYNTRAFAGFKDNVLLGRNDAVESPFVGGGLDVMFFRLPSDGLEFYVFGSGEYIRYLSARDTDDEATGIVQSQIEKSVSERWALGATAQYLYFDQVLDASTIFRELAAIQIVGHGYSLTPFVKYKFHAPYWLQLELEGTRQQFKEFLDDYWEGGPRLELGRTYGRRSEWTLGYEIHRRAYDERLARTRESLPIAGRGLEFQLHEIEAEIRHYWDEERRWRSVGRAGLERAEDNGADYYNYWRWTASHQLRYRATKWEIRSDLRFSYYDYDVQTVSATDDSTRARANLTVGIRGEREILESLRAFALYEHERSISNLADDEYRVNSVRAGIDWEF